MFACVVCISSTRAVKSMQISFSVCLLISICMCFVELQHAELSLCVIGGLVVIVTLRNTRLEAGFL